MKDDTFLWARPIKSLGTTDVSAPSYSYIIHFKCSECARKLKSKHGIYADVIKSELYWPKGYDPARRKSRHTKVIQGYPSFLDGLQDI